MKTQRAILLLLGILCSQMVFCQQRTRSLERAPQDLPRLSVGELKPSVADDHTYLSVVSADSQVLSLVLHKWMISRDTAAIYEMKIGPGAQKLPIYLFDLWPGFYTLQVKSENRIVTIRSLKVER